MLPSSPSGYGRVWYHPKGITNILGMSKIVDKDKYWVQYDSQESKYFIVTRLKDSKDTRFCRYPRGLHWLDTNATTTRMDREVIVEDNKYGYTRCSYLRAKLAREI